MTLRKKYRNNKESHRDRIQEKVDDKAWVRGRLESWYLCHGVKKVKRKTNPDDIFDCSSLRTDRNLGKRMKAFNKAKAKGLL